MKISFNPGDASITILNPNELVYPEEVYNALKTLGATRSGNTHLRYEDRLYYFDSNSRELLATRRRLKILPLLDVG